MTYLWCRQYSSSHRDKQQLFVEPTVPRQFGSKFAEMKYVSKNACTACVHITYNRSIMSTCRRPCITRLVKYGCIPNYDPVEMEAWTFARCSGWMDPMYMAWLTSFLDALGFDTYNRVNGPAASLLDLTHKVIHWIDWYIHTSTNVHIYINTCLARTRWLDTSFFTVGGSSRGRTYILCRHSG